MYRHALELYLKAAIARSQPFHSLSPADQRHELQDHSLSRLWAKVKPLLSPNIDATDADTFEAQLLQLNKLDEKSDGFRYPFGFQDKGGTRKAVLDGLSESSFDNFVWILDGLVNWVSGLEDAEERYREYEQSLGK